MQSDSVSRAELRRIAFSRIRERITSSCVCLPIQSGCYGIEGRIADSPANLEGWRGHWGKFGGDGEYAVEFAVGIWGGDFGGDTSDDSDNGRSVRV